MSNDENGSDLTTFNLAASTVLTAFGVFSLVYLIPDHVPASTGLDQGLSARFMPYVAVGALTLLTFILGLNVFIRRVRGLGPISEDNEDNDEPGFGARESVNTVILLFGAAVYVGMLMATGFVLASALGLAVCLFLGGVRNWLVIGVLSIGVPFVLAQVLWWGLTIQVPAFPLLE